MFKEIFNISEEVAVSFPGLEINWNIMENHSITALTAQTINNRKQIEHIQLKQFTHQTWMLNLIGGITAPPIIILTILIFYLRRNRIIIKFKHPRPKGLDVPT